MFSNSPDKGLSAGEDSKILILNNVFSSNNSTIAIKDLSEIFILINKFTNNKLNLNSYH